MTKRAIICSQSNFATDYRIEKMRQTFVAAGYDVLLLGRRHPREAREQKPGTRYMRLLFWHGPLFYAELNIRIALYLIFHRKVDLFDAIDLDTLPGCLLASNIRRTRLMFDSHELFPEVPEIADKPVVKKVWWRIQDFCVPRMRPSDIRVTVCQSIADVFKQKYGADFIVVRNAPLAERAEQLKDAEQPADGDRLFNILYQGAVNVGRGVEEAIEALPSLPDCRLTVVGDGDMMDAARKMATDKGVDDRVTFTGRKPFGELAPYMASADLGLVFMKNTSLNQYYALPNRLFDFIQAGLPILGNNIPETSRLIRGHDLGLCIENVDATSIAQAVSDIKSHPDHLATWRANMKALAPSLTWEADAAQLAEVL